MVDEKQPLTKEERRQRQNRFEQARRRQRNGDTLPPTVDIGLATPVVEAPATRRCGRPKRPDITAADVQGLKYFERIAPLVEPLHNVGCERDQAGNRKFHYDDLCKHPHRCHAQRRGRK